MKSLSELAGRVTKNVEKEGAVTSSVNISVVQVYS